MIHIKNLYLHYKTFNIGLKWNSYLTSLSLRGSVNLSTPIFGNINLTETKKNLIGSLLGHHNLCLHPKFLKIIFEPNPYLKSISCRSPVNPSTHTFPNNNLTRTIKNLLVVSNITEKWQQEFLFTLVYLWYELEIILLSEVTFPSWPGKSINPNFWQYQSDRNNDKLTCCLEIYSEWL